jgi:hypothetical protein
MCWVCKALSAIFHPLKLSNSGILSIDKEYKEYTNTGCLKIASTKKKLWHLEATEIQKTNFYFFLNKRDKVTLSQHILRLRRGSIF